MKKIISFILLLITIQVCLIFIFAQTTQKAKLVVQIGHSNIIGAIAFSPDGRFLISGDGFAKVLILWETATGRELRRFAGHNEGILAVAFSHNGQFIASVSKDKTLREWEILTGREVLKINLTGYEDIESNPLSVLAFTEDDKAILTGSKTAQRSSMQIWDSVDGKLLKNEKLIEPLAISPDGKFGLIWDNSSSTSKYLIWNLSENRAVNQLKYENGEILRENIDSISFSSDGATVSAVIAERSSANKVSNEKIKYSKSIEKNTVEIISYKMIIWDAFTGNIIKNIDDISPNKKSILVRKNNAGMREYVLFSSCPNSQKTKENPGVESLCTIDLKSGKKTEIPLKIFLNYSNQILAIAVSGDGTFVAVGGGDSTVTIINTADNKVINWLTGKMPYIFDVKIGVDGKSISTLAENNAEVRWDLASGQPVLEKKGEETGKGIVDKTIDIISPDGKWRLYKNEKDPQAAVLKNATKENILINEINENSIIEAAAFSPDNLSVAIGFVNGSIKVYSVADGKLIKSFNGHTGIVYSIAFMPDGKTLVTGSMDCTMRLWDAETGKEKVRLITAFDGSWTVITPEGLFDASPEARKLMHYVVGLETVTLEQMKDSYYVPGLLSKIIKGSPLPDVELFSQKDLFPDVQFSQPKDGQKDLTINIKNRGGGIGQIQVLVNGKEFVKDARPPNFDVNIKETTLAVSLKDAPFVAGNENKIEVIAKNASGSLTNRGTRGAQILYFNDSKKQIETPNIYAIIGGISDYTNDNLKLNFAAKDAEEFAKTLEIGATALVDDKTKVHIRLLTSNGDKSAVKLTSPDAKISTATKSDFERAFADFKDATSNDVFIVYLAGHGVSLNLNQNLNQTSGDTYLYLTQEATTTDKSVLSIENSRKAMTVSSEELKDFMKQNKALKQVLILDTCAAGQLAASLVSKREGMSGDQVRAIERLKDNTGFYVLMGSSADAVSYEASQYGQGLLTYSLLQGMKGAGLKEDVLADVEYLFGYAVKKVPEMAKNIGGIQQPRIITPDTSQSFDIGRFTDTEKKKIIIAQPKPLILRPNLQNEKLRFDNLKLTALLRQELRNISFVATPGADSPIVFVEADEMTDANIPSGSYTIDGENLKITVVLVKNNEQIGKEISVSGKIAEKEQVIKNLAAEIVKSVK